MVNTGRGWYEEGVQSGDRAQRGRVLPAGAIVAFPVDTSPHTSSRMNDLGVTPEIFAQRHVGLHVVCRNVQVYMEDRTWTSSCIYHRTLDAQALEKPLKFTLGLYPVWGIVGHFDVDADECDVSECHVGSEAIDEAPLNFGNGGNRRDIVEMQAVDGCHVRGRSLIDVGDNEDRPQRGVQIFALDEVDGDRVGDVGDEEDAPTICTIFLFRHRHPHPHPRHSQTPLDCFLDEQLGLVRIFQCDKSGLPSICYDLVAREQVPHLALLKADVGKDFLPNPSIDNAWRSRSL